MTNKRGKMQGVPVSREEVLQALGDPWDWAENERRLEFQKRLKPGNMELDITGIKGYPDLDGYLTYLQKSLKQPLGTNTGLVSEKENQQIFRTVTSEIRLEITKYSNLLKRLENLPKEVQKHIENLERWLLYKKLMKNPNKELTGGIKQLEDEIRRCTLLLQQLAKN